MCFVFRMGFIKKLQAKKVRGGHKVIVYYAQRVGDLGRSMKHSATKCRSTKVFSSVAKALDAANDIVEYITSTKGGGGRKKKPPATTKDVEDQASDEKVVVARSSCVCSVFFVHWLSSSRQVDFKVISFLKR